MKFSWDQFTLESVLSAQVQYKILISAIILIVLYVVRKIIFAALERRRINKEIVYEWRKNSRYLVFFIGFFAILRVWFDGFQSLITFLGLVSAGLAIALKDLVANLGGWFFIVSRRPFNVGDRIEIGEYAGDVVDIRLFQFTLLEIKNWVGSDQTTGRLIHVPNGKVLTNPQANYTQGFQYIWDEVSATITFESDFKAAQKILKEIIDAESIPLTENAEKEFAEVQKRYLIIHGKLTPKVYLEVVKNGVKLSGRYLVPARKRRDTANNVWEAFTEAVYLHPDIAFAYPTTRFYRGEEAGPQEEQEP